MKIIREEKAIGQVGQSIVEYIILVAAVIAVLIIFLGRGGTFEKSYNKVISTQGDDITSMSEKIFF